LGGAQHRLNRKSLTESKAFGDEAYAKDELVSDMTSAFIAAEKGIPFSPEQTAAHVASWLKALKNDKNAIFKAAHDASAATDFILGMEQDKAVDDPAEAPSPIERVTESRKQAQRQR
jgi:antirestriction protein ArdC